MNCNLQIRSTKLQFQVLEVTALKMNRELYCTSTQQRGFVPRAVMS
jgi:hypothetical protein